MYDKPYCYGREWDNSCLCPYEKTCKEIHESSAVIITEERGMKESQEKMCLECLVGMVCKSIGTDTIGL